MYCCCLCALEASLTTTNFLRLYSGYAYLAVHFRLIQILLFIYFFIKLFICNFYYLSVYLLICFILLYCIFNFNAVFILFISLFQLFKYDLIIESKKLLVTGQKNRSFTSRHSFTCCVGGSGALDWECGFDSGEQRPDVPPAEDPSRTHLDLLHPPDLPLHLWEQAHGHYCQGACHITSVRVCLSVFGITYFSHFKQCQKHLVRIWVWKCVRV